MQNFKNYLIFLKQKAIIKNKNTLYNSKGSSVIWKIL